MLDRQHPRIGRRLSHELHNRQETLVGVIQQQIAPPDDLKHVPFSKEVRRGRLKRRELQIRAVDLGQFHELSQAEPELVGLDLIRSQLQVADQQVSNRIRGLPGDLQPHDRAEMAQIHLFLDCRQQVSRLIFFQVQVCIPGYTKGIPGLNRQPVKEQIQVGCDEILQPDELRRALIDRRLLRDRNGDQAREQVRHLDPGEAGALFGIARHHSQIEAQVGDMGKGMGRIEGQRGERRKDFLGEILAQRQPLVLG